MWNNLKNWQKSGIILVVTYVVLYIMGIMIVPIQSVDHLENYQWPPLIYSIFLALPILIIKYSQERVLKIIASIVIALFLLSMIVPAVLLSVDGGARFDDLSGPPYNNLFVGIFSLLYAWPLMGGLLTFMLLFGLSM